MGFLARRGSCRSTGFGVNAVRKWVRTLVRGAAVIDLGCRPGFPITEVLHRSFNGNVETEHQK